MNLFHQTCHYWSHSDVDVRSFGDAWCPILQVDLTCTSMGGVVVAPAFWLLALRTEANVGSVDECMTHHILRPCLPSGRGRLWNGCIGHATHRVISPCMVYVPMMCMIHSGTLCILQHDAACSVHAKCRHGAYYATVYTCRHCAFHRRMIVPKLYISYVDTVHIMR